MYMHVALNDEDRLVENLDALRRCSYLVNEHVKTEGAKNASSVSIFCLLLAFNFKLALKCYKR